MSSGRVLGLLNGMMIEYDQSTLAPLGLVVGADELLGKRIYVIDSGIDEGCMVDDLEGMEGAECGSTNGMQQREQALMLMNEDSSVVVIQPNEDGSYWRKIVRNKMIREREKRRLLAAKDFAMLHKQTTSSPTASWMYSGPAGSSSTTSNSDSDEPDVVSSWGPYTSTQGTAKKTGVSGLTMPAER